MCKSIASLAVVAALALFVGSAWGAAYSWDHGELDTYWHSPNNWDPNGVPTAADDASVDADLGEANMPIIQAGQSAFASTLVVSSGIYQDWNTWLTVDGNLTVVGESAFIGSWFPEPDRWTPKGTLVVRPGAVVDMTGDPGRIWVGYRNRGDLQMLGGTFTVNQMELGRGDDCPYLVPGPYPGGSHTLLDAGTITIHQFFTMRMGYPECGGAGAVQWPDADAHMDVNLGTMIIDGDSKAELDQYVADGWITAYGDPCNPGDPLYWYQPGTDPNNYWMPKRASVFVDYGIRGLEQTTLTAYLAGRGEAWNPSPLYGTLDVNLTPALTWSPGDYVKLGGQFKGVPSQKYGNGHHVIFHTDKTTLNKEIKGLLRVGTLGTATGTFPVQDANSRNIAADFGGLLNLDTVYYWCIVETNDVNAPTGDPNVSGWVGWVEPNLSKWAWKSAVWTFRTVGGIAANPYPANGALLEYDLGQTLDVNLTWTRGFFAADVNGHDVYLGTVFTDVNEANVAVPRGVYMGRQTAQIYHIPSLKLGVTYYWRIDEIKDANLWKGTTWNFTVGNYRVVEYFNYSNDANLLARWKEHRATVDCSLNGTSGDISLDRGTMRFDYDNNESLWFYDYFSEVRYEYAAPVNWTVGDGTNHLRALYVAFLGAAGNSADPNYDRMYVAVEDSAGNLAMVLHDDPSAQRKTAWQQWNIDLRDFSDAGVSLTTVKYLYLGFGLRCNDRSNDLPGGKGTVYFDNIRLYIPRCLGTPGYRQLGDLTGPLGGTTGDCVVDLRDVKAMAADWLDSDLLVTSTDPGNGGLQGYYKFNEVSGPNAADSSGNGRTATALYRYFTDPCDANTLQLLPVTDANWNASGYSGGCVNFGMARAPDGNDVNYGVTLPDTVFAGVSNKVAISLWIYGRDANWQENDWRPLFMDFNNTLTAWCPTPPYWGGLPFLESVHFVAAGNTAVWTQIDANLYSGKWNHFTFIKDVDADVVSIWNNGLLMAETTAAGGPVSASRFTIGCRADILSNWRGRVDELRIYNRNLSEGEIMFLAGFAPGATRYYAITSPANLTDPEPVSYRKVNLKDLAVLAQNWLTSDFWPLGTSP